MNSEHEPSRWPVTVPSEFERPAQRCVRCEVARTDYGSLCRRCYERLPEALCTPKVLEVIHGD